MIEFKRTEDADLIKSVVCLDGVYQKLFDDFAPSSDQWEPTIHPLVGYTTITEYGELLGIAICAAHSAVQLEVHNAILPHVGWKKRLRIVHEFFTWLGECGYKRVIGKVPESNRYAVAFNEAAGMERFGENKLAIQKSGILESEIWFGVSLPLS